MIRSFRSGRVRLRAPSLRAEGALDEIRNMLAAYPGIREIQTNTRIGSLLVSYDPARISEESLHAAVAALKEKFPAPVCKKTGPTLRKAEKRLMLGAALLSLSGAMFDRMPLHKIGGAAFFLLAGRHVFCRRRAF